VAQQVAGGTLPQVTVGGTVTMTYRQLNTDGAGPITYQVSADGAQCFNTMQVTVNVPGNNGRSSVADAGFVSPPVDCDVTGATSCRAKDSRGPNAGRRYLHMNHRQCNECLHCPVQEPCWPVWEQCYCPDSRSGKQTSFRGVRDDESIGVRA
jgi:hypothetical protein